nr:hypothetical protein [uncultured Faecalibacillus sp.]
MKINHIHVPEIFSMLEESMIATIQLSNSPTKIYSLMAGTST